MRHIVSVGGGITSSLILPLWIKEHHPGEQVDLVIAKLPNEDPDVWRLVSQASALTGYPVTYIGRGVDPWRIFWERRFIGNSQIDPCSLHLKREVMRKYMIDTATPEDILYVGIGPQEDDRFLPIYERWKTSGFQVKAPLRFEQEWTRERQMSFCQEMVGFIPRLYLMGFTHNNCGGACVKAGMKEWARLLYFLPDVYNYWERMEFQFREFYWTKKNAEGHRYGDVAILRDRSGGKTTPLPLYEFRARIEKRWAKWLPGFVGIMDGWADLEASGALADLDESPGCAFCNAA